MLHVEQCFDFIELIYFLLHTFPWKGFKRNKSVLSLNKEHEFLLGV
jgi:hypothetical protein